MIGLKEFKLWCCVAAVVLVTAACSTGGGGQQSPSLTRDSIPTLITQVQKVSRLYTAEVKVHKIVTHNDDLKLSGSLWQQDFDLELPFGTRRVAIPLDATVKAYIDFSGFGTNNVRRQGERIEIILPDPTVEITATRINHDDVKKRVPLLRSNFTDAELAQYAQHGREAIVKDLPALNIPRMAQQSAARMLVPMLREMGYNEEDITVTFRKDLRTTDLVRNIKEKIEQQ